MGGHALRATPDDVDDATARTDSGTETDSPGLRLLGALGAGDDAAVLALCGPTTTVSAANLGWSCRGHDEIGRILAEAREVFPGLTFESRTRHVGFGLVIDEARVRDVRREPEPIADPAPTGRTVTLWNDSGGAEPAAALDLPVRVRVRHDDLQVHEVTLSFPAALVRRALGMRVDPFELSLSEVQSAFVAPAGSELTTQALPGSGVPPAPPLTAPDPAPPTEEVLSQARRRRRGRRTLVLLALLALLAAGTWWVVQGRDGQAGRPTSGAPSASVAVRSTPSAAVSASARSSQSQAPTVTHAQPSGTPSGTPNVTLRSDLAFGFNSATLSAEAKSAIDAVARQTVRAGLRGRIFVDGYTDSTGSATYGLLLSQRRADTVSTYLQSRLLGAPVSIVSTGHGEADPEADNKTAAGRRSNRRVTITLPT